MSISASLQLGHRPRLAGLCWGASEFFSSLLDLGLFHYLFPPLSDRAKFLAAATHHILRNGARFGLSALLVSIIVPFLMIAYFKKLPQLTGKRHAILLIVWISLVAFLSCVLALDHTRVACLITFAPMIVFLRSQPWCNISDRDQRNLFFGFMTFFFARLVIPHVDGNGFELFEWEELRQVVTTFL